VAHLAAIKGRVPFINFFDGFRTSHELQKVAVWDYADLKPTCCDMDAVNEFRARPEPQPSHHARLPRERRYLLPEPRGFQQVLRRPARHTVEEYMGKINAKLGTDYKLFNYYGAPDADRVIVAMGSICDVAEEVIDYLNAKGEKVGL
jgi:pyruvate-ferredoxin/flavodoxin oxidoreductase